MSLVTQVAPLAPLHEASTLFREGSAGFQPGSFVQTFLIPVWLGLTSLTLSSSLGNSVSFLLLSGTAASVESLNSWITQ